jgi:hypothetical protein
MFQSSWDHNQAVLYNTRLTELSIWIHILIQRVRIIKVMKVVEIVPCVMMRTAILKTLKCQKVYKKFVFKNVGGCYIEVNY